MSFNEEFNEKFKGLNIKVPFVPKTFQVKELKRNLKDIEFANADEFLLFLTTEREFWHAFQGNQFFKRYVSEYDNAINNLNYASKYISNCKAYIDNALNNIINIPNSKSILTKELLKYKNQNEKFFAGFIDGINNTDRSFSSQSKYYMMGMYKAFQYIEVIKKIDDILPEQQDCFENTQVTFINAANEYVKKYDELFVQKEQEFKEMDAKIADELKRQKEMYSNFLQEKNQTMQDLEQLYSENLRLKKPAEYWKKMSVDYETKARKYIGWSIAIASISIILLSLLIIFVPEATKTSHWFDLVKNTAILTVITTILVYAIRVFVKMAMSSYHLARDAKEREQLTYLYLSLINEKAVTESERELVITSLFSRSDTGLLKGDSSPEMPTINFTDMFNKKN